MSKNKFNINEEINSSPAQKFFTKPEEANRNNRVNTETKEKNEESKVVRIKVSYHDIFRKKAFENNTSINSYVNEAIEEYLENHNIKQRYL